MRQYHGNKNYRQMLADLDERGVNIRIQRIAPKWYEVHQNFRAVKKYKLRRSANKYIQNIYKKTIL